MSIDPRTLQLEEWEIGKRKFRYLFLCSDCSFKLRSGNLTEDNMIPVFLGADVVAQTGIRTENHPKLHAKFSKKGLAARLNFSTDFKFERLRLPSGINTLWFYSIQGLFRVAFDLYDREDQLSVIENLQILWKSRINDGPLQKEYNLENCLSNPDLSEKSTLRCQSEEERHLFNQSPNSSYDPCRNVPSIHLIPDITEHNYCLSDCYGSRSSHWEEASGSGLVFQKIKTLLHISTNESISLNDQMKTSVLMLLDVIEHVIHGLQNFDKMASSIVQLLDAASFFFVESSSANATPSVYDNRLLLEVSSWLGNRFQRENDCISRQVEEFKRKHIDHISDLPPAQELVAALFPKAMKVLFLNWMGLSDKTKLQSEYPILLLMLEFVNRNLITGVAHVLYSTLICK
ncbi:hypothetical protein XENTR_v10002523 [Xenopus tropicalis]|uniref:Uncharacterized protein LOC101733994 n=1 Tax=Xenopus tropicalis TaxID=8364 RepID=A0A8J0T0B6_XENTR|nr:uncharacterized protein LOC101733994 [Xenopus tropicalis]XP_031748462.1 uncharacterized protein LOC101733994 [Xenopus tropicalis]KAE8635134.1 hypothetical protein XENTR_v10002523 [Xenopus tropicalis]KAE8635135.1 hypothetical protein XENTR_v10002523 [Xenopus tropicalis]KAE8635136.1 hypothetical protein XENTR_v10002523 [Xenopus tropicalis]|eukprot:XP_017945977.1 PREDICTED: uncharacterized protein LOC101733994 [Xenopus tropicalis]